LDIVEIFHTVCCGACAWDLSRVYYGLDFPFSKLSKAKKVSGTTALLGRIRKLMHTYIKCLAPFPLNVVYRIKQ
jgi:hypothetical protein